MNIIFFNHNLLITSIDRDIRWNFTHDLLFNYLNLYSTINTTLDIFKKLEKKKSSIITFENRLRFEYLRYIAHFSQIIDSPSGLELFNY